MSHICVLICRVDDPTRDTMTELAAFNLPQADITVLQPETTLDELETITHTTGNAMLRRLLQAQWDIIDTQLTEQHRRSFPPGVVHADGRESVTLASRFGTLKLSRQVCQHADTQSHVMPGNAVLPPHNGMITTRGLQEWACLLPQELSFATVARLLGWQTLEPQVLSATSIHILVCSHGQIICQAEHWPDRVQNHVINGVWWHHMPHMIYRASTMAARFLCRNTTVESISKHCSSALFQTRHLRLLFVFNGM
jgi:hypothetical protein